MKTAKPTPHAKAAHAIRWELKRKYPGHTFTVRSSRFSGGDSVTVGLPPDLDHEAVREIRTLLNKYQKGRFNGMTDGYDYDNKRDDVPQVMFVHAEIRS